MLLKKNTKPTNVTEVIIELVRYKGEYPVESLLTSV